MAQPGGAGAASEATSLVGALPDDLVGLRVLVVDDDPLCTMIVAKMLRSCGYHVTTADGGNAALALLRADGSAFDLVLSDVQMPDVDGFRLMELVALELDVPVIMMSANGETSVVLRGITHGAVDYLLKPVRIEELRNIWQHVVRRPREQSAGVSSAEGEPEARSAPTGRGADKPTGRKEKSKRKDGDGDGDGAEQEDATQLKKPRVVWSVELHQQFVNAVNSLGIDKAVPKRILDLMGVAGLTRENVASHLQKYRLYLKRLQSVQSSAAAAEASGAGRAAAYAHASPPPPPPAPPPRPPPPRVPTPPPPHAFAAAAFDVQLPGTAPGGGYPSHLLPLGGLNPPAMGGVGGLGSMGIRLGGYGAPSSPHLGASLSEDIQAVSELDMGIHGLSMDALGGDELLLLEPAAGAGGGGCMPCAGGGGLPPRLQPGGGLNPSPSSDHLLSLFLKDALPEVAGDA